MIDRRTLTGFIPTYSNARSMLKHVNGLTVVQYQAIQLYIEDGLRKEYPSPSSVQRPVEPLTTESRRIAHNILVELKDLNQDGGSPPNVKFREGFESLCKVHRLTMHRNGRIVVTQNGTRFMQEDVEFVAQIDSHEGFLFILHELAKRGPQRINAVKELFDTFRFNTFEPERLKTGYHKERLENLADRGLVTADKDSKEYLYQITDEGRTYLRRTEVSVAQLKTSRWDKSVADGMHAQFLQDLQNWNGFEFEWLVACLLEKMGYANVTVTKKSNDKGADVVATLGLGVSELPIAVQAKCHSKDVGRDVLDKLRGSLHRFNAVQGMVVSTAGFSLTAQEASKEMGAPPIRLIDGEELIELFLECDMVESNGSDGSLRFRPRVTSYVKTRMTQN